MIKRTLILATAVGVAFLNGSALIAKTTVTCKDFTPADFPQNQERHGNGNYWKKQFGEVHIHFEQNMSGVSWTGYQIDRYPREITLLTSVASPQAIIGGYRGAPICRYKFMFDSNVPVTMEVTQNTYFGCTIPHPRSEPGTFSCEG